MDVSFPAFDLSLQLGNLVVHLSLLRQSHVCLNSFVFEFHTHHCSLHFCSIDTQTALEFSIFFFELSNANVGQTKLFLRLFIAFSVGVYLVGKLALLLQADLVDLSNELLRFVLDGFELFVNCLFILGSQS